MKEDKLVWVILLVGGSIVYALGAYLIGIFLICCSLFWAKF